MLLKFKNFDIPEAIESLNYVPFREMIRLFLGELTEVKQAIFGGMKIWSNLVITEPNGVVFPLYVVEETVQSSPNPLCDHCKFTGWGHHYVSKRRYHLIIPEKDRWDKTLTGGFSELRTHILYGLIHCNGYGHLICVNGFIVDSNIFCESDLMDFLDRICSTLNARKLSVCDSLKEGAMELRLLHAVAFRQSWFGKWGFKFSHGSNGVTENKYETAVDCLSSLGLDKIIYDFKDKVAGRRVKKIIDKYAEMRDTPLITISDLFKFMLGFKLRGSTRSSRKAGTKSSTEQDLKALGHPLTMSFDTLVTSLAKSCRWPARRIEYVLIVVVNFLKDKKANSDRKRGISRQELRDEIRKWVGDTGLIDFVLKSIKCFVMGNHIIRRSINSSTRKYEFKIEEVVKETEPTGFLLSTFTSDSRWHGKTVQQAEEVAISLLKAICDKNAIPWQDLQEKARESVGASGLIDLLLKAKSDTGIGNQITPPSINSSTETVEFATEDVLNLGVAENLKRLPRLEIAYERDVYEDILFLYRNVLFGYKESVSLASRIVIDGKQFVKEWFLEDQKVNQLMAITCQVLPSFKELETELLRPLSPGEVLVISPSVTVNELKGFAQSALRDVYCIMDKFAVKQIGGLRAIEDDKVLSCTLKPNCHVWIRGSGLDLDTKLRYEGGPVELIVDCNCGTRTDDGEKMMPCAVCQVRQHTRCNGIDDDDDDDEAAPSVFQGASCSGD